MDEGPHELPRRLAELRQALAAEGRVLPGAVQDGQHVEAVLGEALDFTGVVLAVVGAALTGDEDLERPLTSQERRRRAEVPRCRAVAEYAVPWNEIVPIGVTVAESSIAHASGPT